MKQYDPQAVQTVINFIKESKPKQDCVNCPKHEECDKDISNILLCNAEYAIKLNNWKIRLNRWETRLQNGINK